MERKIEGKRALELLKEAYPESKIEVQETENPRADGILVKDNTFVAWIEEGTVIVGEFRLSKIVLTGNERK